MDVYLKYEGYVALSVMSCQTSVDILSLCRQWLSCCESSLGFIRNYKVGHVLDWHHW